MSDLTPEQMAQLPVLSGAWAFLEPIADGDFARGWPAVDPLLRRCWAQEWLHANGAQLAADGFDRDQVLATFLNDDPDHELWHHFVRVYQRSLSRVLGDIEPQNRGLGTGTRIVAPDIELLYLHDVSTLPGGQWQPGAASYVRAILMRHDGGTWRVLNINSETTPEPGWPPQLT